MRHTMKFCTILTSFVLALTCLAKADNALQPWPG